VRVISNNSTGELGHCIVRALIKKEALVTLLQGPVLHSENLKSVRVIKFNYFDELSKLFKNELKKKYDCVIHSAAVSDYRPVRPVMTKMTSDLRKISLQLIPTEKLIAKVKTVSPNSFLVGFKLECRSNNSFLATKASRLIKNFGCDLVVANSQMSRRYTALIFDKHMRLLAKKTTRQGIAHRLVEILGDIL
jgi:phosphopantothenoylcysteine decarboxylase/phosphopantothenate--cysteine ligase